MMIRDMFQDNINRPINGVIKVDQDAANVVEQEVHALVQNAITLIDDVLSQQKDNIALIDRVLKKADDLLDNKDDMAQVEGFFKNQVTVFDSAVKLERDLANELDYLSKEPEANTALNQIRLIIVVNVGDSKYVYKCIPELNDLMRTVHEGHDRLLAAKRDELMEIVRQCMEAIHRAAGSNPDCKTVITTADTFYDQRKQRIRELQSLALLDGLVPSMHLLTVNHCRNLEKQGEDYRQEMHHYLFAIGMS